MKEEMKILHILHELHPSGAEMMIYNSYPYWKDDCRCTVMSTGKIIGPFAEKLENKGYEVVYIPTNGAGKLAKLRHLVSFYKYMRQHKYDAIHIHRESLSFEYALICVFTGSGKICRTVHSTFAHHGIQRKIKSLTRWLMKQWLHVTFIAISDGVAANEEKVFGNECQGIIYNWCDNKKFHFVSLEERKAAKKELDQDDKMCIVTVGNCGKVKNHQLLINAIPLMKYKNSIRYYHVGFAVDETENERMLAQNLGIGEAIEFVGSADPKPYLKAAEIYVMTSLYEGLSIAALEAIYTGMHVLLADVPGLTEFKNKKLVNVDYFLPEAEQLAKALDRYVEIYMTGELLPSLEQSNRAKELYDIEQQVRKYVMVYRALQS